MKRLIVLASILSSGGLFGTALPPPPDIYNPIDDVMVEYYTPDEAYEELLGWEEKSGLIFENNIRICIEDGDCKFFYHADSASDPITYITLAKAPKPRGGGNNAGTGIDKVLTAIGKGISGSGTIKIKSLKVNADGSFELKGLEISAGVGVGTDAPQPGHDEDGKQVQHY